MVLVVIIVVLIIAVAYFSTMIRRHNRKGWIGIGAVVVVLGLGLLVSYPTSSHHSSTVTPVTPTDESVVSSVESFIQQEGVTQAPVISGNGTDHAFSFRAPVGSTIVLSASCTGTGMIEVAEAGVTYPNLPNEFLCHIPNGGMVESVSYKAPTSETVITITATAGQRWWAAAGMATPRGAV